jgi:(p)ppGpp synthase/HD superfamily hydrolase
LVTYSKCCFPIPGDAVLGTFTAGHGLVVHTSDCPNISELRKQPDRCLLVDWDEMLDQKFSVRLHVRVRHETGAFAHVASAIAENDSNIYHVDLHDGSESLRLMDFIIDVKDRVHLAQIMKQIKRLPTVAKVVRKKG